MTYEVTLKGWGKRKPTSMRIQETRMVHCHLCGLPVGEQKMNFWI